MWTLFLAYLPGHLVGEREQLRALHPSREFWVLCISIKMQTGSSACLCRLLMEQSIEDIWMVWRDTWSQRFA